MADNKSCEDKENLLERIQQDLNWNRITKQDLKSLIEDNKNTRRSVGSFTVDINCDDALKGLKAVQREAKKATAAIKELDNIRKHTCPECKTISLNIDTLNSDNGPVMQSKRCTHCSYEEVINIE